MGGLIQVSFFIHSSHPSQASLPHPTFPDSSMLMPNWPWWQECLGDSIQALFWMHSSHLSEASLPHPTFPDSCMLMPNWPCWQGCLSGPIQALFFFDKVQHVTIVLPHPSSQHDQIQVQILYIHHHSTCCSTSIPIHAKYLT